MRGVSPSQTLPIAGGKPPAPPTSTSMTLQNQQDARTTMTKLPHAEPPASFASPLPAHVSVSVTASVPPVTTATPRRTRRSPPRVLFLECAGSCTCSCLLPAPAPRPTIDASQGPAPRPGVSAATGLHRMSARPTDHSGRPARAGEIAKVQSSSIAKHNPPLTPTAPSLSLGPFRGPALRRNYSRRPNHQPASALPPPAPLRLVPRTLRRRHTIQQYKRGAVLPP